MVTDRLRAAAEHTHGAELAALRADDPGARPTGWRLTPKAVRRFIIGDPATGITRKFYGDDALVDRCIVTLMSDRALLLVGEPGTAKSMLSELLTAAICGDSTATIQGSSGTTADQITYGWNYALLLAEGPSPRALVKSPLYEAIEAGRLCRFEEVTRVQPEVQDTLIGLLSDKLLRVPELDGDDAIVYAARGFNLVATANLRDRGVHEMSGALKRRFNFETVRPIADRALEARLITEQTDRLLRRSEVAVRLTPDVVDVLVTTFHDLRTGMTADGAPIPRPTSVMSSAEAVAVGQAAALDAQWFGDGVVTGSHLARQLIGTVLKDNPDDGATLRHYFDVVIKERARDDARWQAMLGARSDLDR